MESALDAVELVVNKISPPDANLTLLSQTTASTAPRLL
jgi:hypothetical protein